jgi:hypothetical protein
MSKAVNVTGREHLQDCEMLRISHCLNNQLTDGSEVVILIHQPYLTPRYIFWYSFLLEAD